MTKKRKPGNKHHRKVPRDEPQGTEEMGHSKTTVHLETDEMGHQKTAVHQVRTTSGDGGRG